MSESGRYNYKGINAQSWAAMSLFLQFLRDPTFSQIDLEAKDFEDFNLVFKDGRKIICESKDRQRKFSYPELREVLESITARSSLGRDDEILVVCTKANPNLLSDVRHVKYFDPVKKKFANKGYEDRHLTLLSSVKFWVVPPSFNEDVIYSLFAELINFWLPAPEIERFVDNILVQRIYKGSAQGSTYSRTQLLKTNNLRN